MRRGLYGICGNGNIFTLTLFDQSASFHHETIPIYVDPLKPHFYIVKLGFTGIYIIFLISVQKT